MSNITTDSSGGDTTGNNVAYATSNNATAQSQKVQILGNYADVIEETVNDYLTLFLQSGKAVDPIIIRREIYDRLRKAVVFFNITCPSKEHYINMSKIKIIPNEMVVALICALHPVIKVSLPGGGQDLAIYQEKGDKEGLYVLDYDEIKKLAALYSPSARESDLNEIVKKLYRKAEEHSMTTDPNLVAVNNGIFDYKNKVLMPFSPKYVFLSKSGVDYNPNAANINIHNDDDGTDWDVESWMNSLSSDPTIVDLLWEVLGAIIRPNVSWDKSIWLYSESGNNGKGTLCSLMRSLCGENSCASINIAGFNCEPKLAELTRVSAVIADENDVGIYIDKAANFKAVITGDAITVDRKFLTAITFSFRGLVVQCVNELPRFKDKSESVLRRLLLIPMEKCFTGNERKYIKHDYLKRKEVLEYVLYKVLNTNYYELSDPLPCQQLLNEYRLYNDPLKQFWEDVSDQLVWDYQPYEWLYDLYKKWMEHKLPKASVIGYRVFTHNIATLVKNDPFWNVMTSPRKARTLLGTPELLILEYDVKTWMRNTSSVCPADRARPSNEKIKNGEWSFRGLQRRIYCSMSDSDAASVGMSIVRQSDCPVAPISEMSAPANAD